MYATAPPRSILLFASALCLTLGLQARARAAGREPGPSDSVGDRAVATATEVTRDRAPATSAELACSTGCGNDSWPSVTSVGPTALPAFFSVPRLALRRGVWAVAQTGYSFLEGHEAVPGDHHSSVSRLALGGVPLPGLQVAVNMEIRHHQHLEPTVDTGTWLETRGDVRWGAPLSSTLSAGVLGAAHVRPTEAGGRFVPEAGLFAHLRPRSARQEYGMRVGYRFWDGERALQEAARYRNSDRLTARVSEFDAMVWALSGEHHIGSAKLVAELSGELLLGAGTPSLLQHPSRVSVGYRHALSDRWGFYGAGHAGLSRRASAASAGRFYPVEPRVSLDIGLAYALRADPERKPSVEAGSIHVDVRAEGFGVSDARVELRRGEERIPLVRRELGIYQALAIPPGSGEIWVTAKRLKPFSRRVMIAPGVPLNLQVQLEPEPIESRISGWVRSPTGEGLAASVRIVELGLTLRTDETGGFDTEAPPGNYTVVLRSQGYRQATRSVEVGDEVLLINVQLQRREP